MPDGTSCPISFTLCEVCGVLAVNRRANRLPARTCGASTCRRAVRNSRMAAYMAKRRRGGRSTGRTTYEGSCARCSAKFTSTKRAQRFCSISCGKSKRPMMPSTALALWSPPVVKVPGSRWRRRVVKHPPLNGSLFVYGPCAWCEGSFMALATDYAHRSLYCSKRCAKNASNHRRGRFILPRKRRLAIYERDGWVCQLCDGPVDPDATDEWRPTLDHIVPQSHQLVPDHSDGNLRLAHLWCNSVRGDESRYTLADLRVA